MAKKQALEVRARTAHTEPGTQTYRAEGERFTHVGEMYKHVEAVKAAPQGEPETAEPGEVVE